jgi:hypothetical protein
MKMQSITATSGDSNCGQTCGLPQDGMFGQTDADKKAVYFGDLQPS